MFRRAAYYLVLLTLVINSAISHAQTQPGPTQAAKAIAARRDTQAAPAPAAIPFLAPGTAARPSASSTPPRHVALDVAQIPLAFVANSGQADPAVRFQVRSMSGSMFFTPGEVTFALPANGDQAPPAHRTAPADPRAAPPARRTAVLRLRFDGANPTPTISGAERLPGTINDLRGNNSARWRTRLATYAGVVYHQLYDGIDLRYDGVDG